MSKPYKDKNGAIWIKQGADKRKLTDNNEQIRLFQQSGSLYVDEMIIPNTSVADVDKSKVEKYMITYKFLNKNVYSGETEPLFRSKQYH